MRFLLLISTLLAAFNTVASPGIIFKTGNRALAEGKNETAIELYEKALEQAPNSAEIYYNLGTALYRAKQYEAAISAFEFAASNSETLRARALYNMGNALVKTGEGFRETDLHSAGAYCRQAAWMYRAALDIDPQFSDAAYNLEIAGLITADIEGEIQQKKEQEQQQNEFFRYVREKLEEFIQRQTELIEQQQTGTPQNSLETDTRELADAIAATGLHKDFPLPDGSAAPGPLKETFEHIARAADAMTIPDQPTALAELVAALGAAPQDPNKQGEETDEKSEEYADSDMEYEQSDKDSDMYEEADPFGDFSEYEEIRGVPPPNQTEMDILAEEIRNQELRKEKKSGEYKPAEKDW